MNDSMTTFFNAWGIIDDAPRLEAISAAFKSDDKYAVPRSPDALRGPAAIASYVYNFSAGAPNCTAKVVNISAVGTSHRAAVATGGMEPDGKEMLQHSQYFADMDGDKITRMVGIGEPE